MTHENNDVLTITIPRESMVDLSSDKEFMDLVMDNLVDKYPKGLEGEITLSAKTLDNLDVEVLIVTGKP